MKSTVYLDTICWNTDIEPLVEMMTSEEQYLFSTKINPLSLQMFEEWISLKLSKDFHDFYVIRRISDKRLIGYIHNYGFSLINRHCKLVTYISPDMRSSGAGAQATITFMDLLFSRYPIEKMYSTVYRYNEESIKCNIGAGFILEGAEKDFRYYNGKHHDLVWFSITRKQFYDKFGGLLK